jgi:hypothetical protein
MPVNKRISAQKYDLSKKRYKITLPSKIKPMLASVSDSLLKQNIQKSTALSLLYIFSRPKLLSASS